MWAPDDEWEPDDEPDHPLAVAIAALGEDGWHESLVREFLAGAPWRHRDELQGSALKVADELAECARLVGGARLDQVLARLTSEESWALLVKRCELRQAGEPDRD